MTLNINIENIVKIENIHNRHKRHRRKIYEVIQQELFYEAEISPEEFSKNCNNNANVPFNIPTCVKNNLNQMVME